MRCSGVSVVYGVARGGHVRLRVHVTCRGRAFVLIYWFLEVVGLGCIDCPGWGSHYMVFDIDVNQLRSQFFSKIQQGSKKIQ